MKTTTRQQAIEQPPSLLLRRKPVLHGMGWFPFASFICFCFFLAFGLVTAQEELLPDPVPVKRIHIPASQLPAELQQQKEGVLQELPRQDFEKRMQMAAQALKSSPQSPHLLKAEYSARLEGTGLVGQGSWEVFNPAIGPGILPLKDLKLALKDTTCDGVEAILGELAGGVKGLWLPRANSQQQVQFNWSLGSSIAAGEMSFEFQVPTCALSTLDLMLPEEYLLVAKKGTLITGPEAGENNMQRWKLHFPGKGKVNFTIHQVKGKQAIQPLLLAHVKTRQTLWPNRLESEYTFEIQVLHNVIDQLVFDWDFPFLPTKVTCSSLDLKEWKVIDLPEPVPSAQPDKQAKPQKALLVRFNEPMRLELPPLKIFCQVPLPKTGQWLSARPQLKNAFSKGEILSLHLHPEIHLEGWQQGSFRLVKAERDASGFEVLTLEDVGTVKVVRPRGKVQLQQPKTAVKQVLWWHIGEKESTVVSQWTYQVNQGKLHEVTLGLPKNWKKGWKLETVELLKPKSMPRKLALSREGPKPQLLVELPQGISTGEQVKLKAVFHIPHPQNIPPGGLVLDFPDLQPLEGGPLQGALGVSIDPLFHGLVSNVSVAASVPDKNGPWANRPLNFYYAYRDQPLSGKLRLVPHQAQFQAFCNSEISLSGREGSLLAQLRLEPLAGTIDTIDLFVSAGLKEPWKLKNASTTKKVASVKRIPGAEVLPPLIGLGINQPLGIAGLLVNYPRGEFWRIKLAQPLTGSESLLLEAPFQPVPSSDKAKEQALHWEIPILTVLNATHSEGVISLEAKGLKVLPIQHQGLVDASQKPSVKGAAKATANSNESRSHFHYLSTKGKIIPQMWIETRPVPVQARGLTGSYEKAHLTTSVEMDGELFHHFKFRVKDWEKDTIPILLPQGVKVLGVRVQGKWLKHIPQIVENNSLRINLPVDAANRLRWYELEYSSRGDQPGWIFWSQVKAPVPQLPITSGYISQSWRLPAGISPLDQASYFSSPAIGNQSSGGMLEPLEHFWFAAENWLWIKNLSGTIPGWEKLQRQNLFGAELKFRPQWNRKTWQLGPALQQMAAEYLPPRTALVVDTQALGDAEITSESLVSSGKTPGQKTEKMDGPFWEMFGLVYVPFPDGALLTTQKQWNLWSREISGPLWQDRNLSKGVKEAVRFGYDASGRFQQVALWTNQSDWEKESPGGILLPNQEEGWTEWEPVPGSDSSKGFLVVNGHNLELLGLVLAVLISLVLWRLSGNLTAGWQFRLLLLWIGFTVIGQVWVPVSIRPSLWWPTLAGLFVLLCCFFLGVKSNSRSKGKKGPESGLGTTLSILFGVSLLLIPGSAPGQFVGNAKSFTVYIFGPAEGPIDKQHVLVSPELLKKLETINKGKALGVPDAVPVKANYTGAIRGAWAEFEAEYRVWCFADNATLFLPLKGVQLVGQARMDEKEVFPLIAESSPGYTISLQGKKDRFVTLTLSFKTKVQSKGEFFEINCGIPRLMQNQLQLELPKDAQVAKAMTSWGYQKWQSEGDTNVLKADLGTADLNQTESQLWVNWRKQDTPKSKTEIEVAEYHFWDLKGAQANLVTIMKYQINKGSVSTFQFEIPNQYFLRSVEFKYPDEKTVGQALNRLKGWKTIQEPGKQILEVELDGPVTGNLQLTLRFITGIATQNPSVKLLLPTPIQAVSTSGLIGYVIDRTDPADSFFKLSISKLDGNIFSRDWQGLGEPSPGNLDHSYRFKRFDSKSLAGLNLTFPNSEIQAQQEIRWQLHSNFAQLNATLNLSNLVNTTFVEWEIPANLTINNLSSFELMRWSVLEKDSRKFLQIWLNNSDGMATVNLKGWVSQPVKSGNYVLPRLALVSPKQFETTMYVSAVKGLAIRPAQTKQMTLFSGDSTLTYQSKETNYFASIIVEPAAIKPQAEIFTQAERVGDQVEIIASVHLTIPVSELQTLTVVARNWPGKDIQLEASRTAEAIHQQKTGKEHLWKIKLLPGVTQQYTLKLAGTIPLDAKGKLAMPEIQIADAEVIHHWLAIAGPQLQQGANQGIVPISDPIQKLVLWPKQAAHIKKQGKLWEVQEKDWRLELLSGSLEGIQTAKVLFAQQQVLLINQAYWVHQAEFYLAVQADTRLQISFPEKSTVQLMTLDDKELSFGNLVEGRLSLTVPASSGVYRFVARWSYSGDEESLTQPKLNPLRLEGATPTPLLYTVHIPQGYELSQKNLSTKESAYSICVAQLMRAEGQLQVVSALVARGVPGFFGQSLDPISQVQKSFYWYCRQVEEYFQQGLVSPAEKGPKTQSLGQWLNQLRSQNKQLAKQHGFETLRQAAEKQPALSSSQRSATYPLPLRGTPISWSIAPGSDPPDLVLTPTIDQSHPRGSFVARWLLVVLLTGLVLSFFPGVVSVARYLWPECLLAFSIIGIAMFELSLVAILLILVAIFVRVFWIIYVTLAWWRRRSLGTTTNGSSSGT